MTFGFPNSLFTLLAGAAVALCSCTTTQQGSVSITKVNPYHLQSSSVTVTDDRMIEFEHRRHLYGAVTAEDYRDRKGQYYSVFWKTQTRNPATVRFDYRQGGSGSAVLTKEMHVSQPKKSNVTKFQVTGDEYWDGGKVTQWKATVVENGVAVAEFKSFLWKE